MFEVFKAFLKKVKNGKSLTIVKIQSDHGGEFVNSGFEYFCLEKGYFHIFSAPRTPQQNGMVERKNRILQEMTRTMISEYSLMLYLGAEVINMPCYILNRVSIRPIIKKTPYKIYCGITPNLSYLDLSDVHVIYCEQVII